MRVRVRMKVRVRDRVKVKNGECQYQDSSSRLPWDTAVHETCVVSKALQRRIKEARIPKIT